MVNTIIALLFTFGTLHLALNEAQRLGSPGQFLAYLIPAAFFVYTVICALRWRRRSSLRTEIVGGSTVYLWTDIDGRQCRSDRDPRPDWDRADGDGDSDGDGGGGGD